MSSLSMRMHRPRQGDAGAVRVFWFSELFRLLRSALISDKPKAANGSRGHDDDHRQGWFPGKPGHDPREQAGAPRQAAQRRPALAPRQGARVSANALRHGLSIPVMADPRLDPEVRALAQRIAAGRRSRLPPARAVAEAQVALARARRLRHDLIAAALRDLLAAADRRRDDVGNVLDDIVDVLRTIEATRARHRRVSPGSSRSPRCAIGRGGGAPTSTSAAWCAS